MLPIPETKNSVTEEDLDIQPHSPFFVLFPIKRISSIVKSLDDNLYVFNVEERWPNPQIFKGFQNIAKIKVYLKEKNDIKAI